LVDAITDAARAAISQLFKEYSVHRFYYCSLITTGEGHAPVISAWSTKALAAAVKELGDDPKALKELKWSYADSPFNCYGEQFFGEVHRIYSARPMSYSLSSKEWQFELETRLKAMEKALARLDGEGLFGTGSKRLGIVINAEIMPPDHTNTDRALRLNPCEALTEWLVESAEPE
jgi:hypothetical protein